MQRISEVLYQEEIWVKQRARVNWLKVGDRNTTFFHSQIARRKSANKIVSLHRSDSTLCNEQAEINTEIQSFY
jgi:hypothetical protein